jgi:ABC-type dipeptide/oligopeptide/nickel transport system permease component
MPTFAIGLLLIWLVADQWRLLPVSGYGGPAWTPEGLRSLILPAVTLAIGAVAAQARLTRAAVLDSLSQEYIRVARAKGLGERGVLLRHALRNALLPLVTLIGLQVGALLGGAVVTETVFAWPGLGRLAITAIQARDLVVVQGVVLVVASLVVLVNLIVDLLYLLIDPCIRYG